MPDTTPAVPAVPAMMAAMPAAATPMGRDGFGRLLRAEWTKLRTVRSTAWCLLAAVGAMLLIGALGSSAVVKTSLDRPTDEFHFVHRSLTGDGTIVARVASQDNSGEWAKAGVIMKESLTPRSAYATMMTTPGHGVRFQSGFNTDVAGSEGKSPRWLRLTRTGATITGYESTNGTAWTKVSAVTLATLPRTVQVGLFVTSPNAQGDRAHLGEILLGNPTIGRATFDKVSLTTTTPQPPAVWGHHDLRHLEKEEVESFGRRPQGTPSAPAGTVSEADGVFTVTGSGDIAPFNRIPGLGVANTLIGVIFAAIPIVALGVLFITSEYRPNVIWTTLAASPRRGRVLAAKAVVLAAVTFAAALVTSVVTFLVGQSILHGNGWRPPNIPQASLLDPAALRAVVGTAAFLALIAVLSLGVGAIMRRSAGAIITTATATVILPLIGPFLPLDAATWIQRLTPLAGLSLRQSDEPFDFEFMPWVGHPWVGFAVLCAYSATALGVAYWLLRRRDA